MAQKEAAISRNSHLHPQPGYKMPRSWSTNRPVFALLHLQVEPGELVDYCCSDVSKRTIYLNFNYLYLLLCCCSVLSLSIKFENSTKITSSLILFANFRFFYWKSVCCFQSAKLKLRLRKFPVSLVAWAWPLFSRSLSCFQILVSKRIRESRRTPHLENPLRNHLGISSKLFYLWYSSTSERLVSLLNYVKALVITQCPV